MKLFGYSERGMVNALCEDIYHHDQPLKMLGHLLSMITFQSGNFPIGTELHDAQLIVEQSFSQYGDLDLLLLVELANSEKHAVFIEAKVHAGQNKTIVDRWHAFQRWMDDCNSVQSNVFQQLYYKCQLVDRLQNDKSNVSGLDSRTQKSLGTNRIVNNSAKLLGEYVSNPWYVALVPDSVDATQTFIDQTFKDSQIDQVDFPSWQGERFGFLTWSSVEENCSKDDGWKRTTENFKWNVGQIYVENSRKPSEIIRGAVYTDTTTSESVGVLQSGNQCRVIPISLCGDCFPESRLVSPSKLDGEGNERFDRRKVLPGKHKTYQWKQPGSSQPQSVTVVGVGNQHSRVVFSDETELLVPNHELLRNGVRED